MLEFFEAISLLEVGIMPNDGGWMEQTWDFVAFRRAVLQQRAECANEKGDAQEAIKEARRGKK